MKERASLFTASDLAKFCEVDLKTIHNWADKGKIKHFRTPGRHLRFRRLDVLDFLRKWGYSVPAVVSQLNAPGSHGKSVIVLIEHDVTKHAAFVAALKDVFDIHTFVDVNVALIAMGEAPPDALVYDAFEAGNNAMTTIIKLVASTERLAHTRCVVYSDHIEMQQKALDLGAYDLIKKGDVDALKDSLMRILGLEREPS